MSKIKKEYKKDGYIYRLESGGNSDEKIAMVQLTTDSTKGSSSGDLLKVEAVANGVDATNKPVYVGKGVLAIIEDKEISDSYVEHNAAAWADSMGFED